MIGANLLRNRGDIVKYQVKKIFCCLFVLFGCVQRPAVTDYNVQITDYSNEQLVEIGRQVYQEGVLANGEPIMATVMGGLEVSGQQFTCIHCHRRSGLGGQEGTIYVPPTNGAYLFAPREKVHMVRPSYTDQTLIEAIAGGVNPLGTTFDEIMPLYNLPDLEMTGLVAYLKELSSKFSPGVDDQAIHIGVVVDAAADKTDRDAMLTVIERFFANKNSESRNESKRRKYAPFYRVDSLQSYRHWKLHIWEVSGPPENWPAQLEKYYRQQPVFTMFSGLVDSSWSPIHEFCEKHRIPSLLPNTVRPVVREKFDFYTMYFSKGVVLDAQVALDDLETQPTRNKIIQVYRRGGDGEDGATAMRSMAGAEGIELHDLALAEDAEIRGMEQVAAKARETGADTMIFWLGAGDLDSLAAGGARLPDNFRIYFTSSLLDGELNRIPAFFKANGVVLHQYNLPQHQANRFKWPATWLRSHEIPLTRPVLQGQTYYACMILMSGLKHIRRNFYGEFLLDSLDHAQRMASYAGNYPTLSFGPEQRYLAKGAYVVDLKTQDIRWIVPDR